MFRGHLSSEEREWKGRMVPPFLGHCGGGHYWGRWACWLNFSSGKFSGGRERILPLSSEVLDYESYEGRGEGQLANMGHKGRSIRKGGEWCSQGSVRCSYRGRRLVFQEGGH